MKRLPEPEREERLALNRILLSGTKLKGPFLDAAQLVRWTRVRLKMTQRQLARRSGVRHSDICEIELGKRDVQMSTLILLFDAMFCELVLVPRQRVRLGDALYAQAEKAAHPFDRRCWMRLPRHQVWNE